jgi:hypothetical protein
MELQNIDLDLLPWYLVTELLYETAHFIFIKQFYFGAGD